VNHQCQEKRYEESVQLLVLLIAAFASVLVPLSCGSALFSCSLPWGADWAHCFRPTVLLGFRGQMTSDLLDSRSCCGGIRWRQNPGPTRAAPFTCGTCRKRLRSCKAGAAILLNGHSLKRREWRHFSGQSSTATRLPAGSPGYLPIWFHLLW